MKKITDLTFMFFFFFVASSVAQTAEVLRSNAAIAETEGNYNEAAVNYEKAAMAFEEQGITDTVCFYRAGSNYLKIDQYGKAIPFFEKSVRLGYMESQSCLLLSDAYWGLKNTEKAEDVLLAGKIKAAENVSDFDKKLAYLYFNTGKYKEAAVEFSKLNDLFPGKKNYMYLYGFSLERIKEYDQAIQLLEAVQKEFPGDKKSKKILGITYFEQTDSLNTAEIKRYESKTDAGLEDYIGTKKRLDRINAGYEKARIILEESLSDYPDDKSIINVLYQIYKKQKDNNKAAQMEKLLK
jgi:tetratricopeptide (TPR) repeat protein